MKFESWLRKQKHRDDPIGDLANDFITSKTKTIKDSFRKYSPCYDVIETYNEACDEYLEYMKNELDIFKDNEDDTSFDEDE